MTKVTLSAHINLALHDFQVDAQFESTSTRLALFGPSGAGKTSILKAIAGIAPSSDSRIKFAGDVWEEPGSRTNTPAHERRTAMVFQDNRLFPHMSVRKNVMYAKPPLPQERVDQIIGLTCIEPLLERSVHTLSGGEQKRVAVARALAADPHLLLLDEPYVGLDRSSVNALRRDLLKLLGTLEVPHILVSHHLEDVLLHAAQVILIEDGGIVGSGSPEDVFTSENGQRLLGAADEMVAAGPLNILKVARTKSSSIEGLEAWELANGRHLLLGASGASREHAYLRVRGADISLALNTPGETSILNVLPAEIAALSASDGFMDVRLDLGQGVFLTARITAYSASKLGLTLGQHVHAMIKSAALTH